MEKVERYVFVDPEKIGPVTKKLRELGVEQRPNFGTDGWLDWNKSVVGSLRAPLELFENQVAQIDGVGYITDRIV